MNQRIKGERDSQFHLQWCAKIEEEAGDKTKTAIKIVLRLQTKETNKFRPEKRNKLKKSLKSRVV